MTARRADLPPSSSLRAVCPTCSRPVRVHVAREFVRAIQQICMVAGVEIPGDLAFITYACEAGHIVVVPVERLGLAS